MACLVRARSASGLRAQLSPRHVPDTMAAVSADPRILTGKKLELPVKRILRGAAPDTVASQGSPAAPESLADLEQPAGDR